MVGAGVGGGDRQPIGSAIPKYSKVLLFLILQTFIHESPMPQLQKRE